MRHPRLVNRVQASLEGVYRVECEARAEAFVVDRETAARLGGSGRADEELLVLEEEEGCLELALYFAPELLARLAALEGHPPEAPLANAPLADAPLSDAFLTGAALGDYCQLAEGVSHFLYLTRAASQERTVSLLELEAQAEVDKFVLCLLARWGEGVGAWGQELLRRLFDDVRYRPHLTGEERWRYEEANRLSRTYCRRLLRHGAARRLDALLSELRYSYRLGAEAKLRHLALPD
jgi:hypothetical protein